MKTNRQICAPEKCTGCAACVNACPARCISLQEDEYGESHPVINEAACKNCDLCVKTCPNNIKLNFQYPTTCFAAWTSNKEKRATCASGGIGAAIAEYVIHCKHGVVVGTGYDADLIPRTICAETLQQAELFKGSKYVQSVISESLFSKILDYLQSGRFVAYIGLPCQIAGLMAFLNNREYSNLITIDLICHGVCPTSYFKEEIVSIVKRHHFADIDNVRFRGNDKYDYKFTLLDKILHPGNRTDYCLTLWQKQKTGKQLLRFSEDSLHNRYLFGFLKGVTLRESCYTCNYARPERVSDISIGDFIGLGSKVPFEYKPENVSSVMLNSLKGEAFYSEISVSMPELTNIRRDYSERLEYKVSLKHPTPRHKLNSRFRYLYKRLGYEKAIKKTAYLPMLKEQTLAVVHNIARLPYDIYTKTIRVIRARDIRA